MAPRGLEGDDFVSVAKLTRHGHSAAKQLTIGST
jgi:hypothetical protein